MEKIQEDDFYYENNIFTGTRQKLNKEINFNLEIMSNNFCICFIEHNGLYNINEIVDTCKMICINNNDFISIHQMIIDKCGYLIDDYHKNQLDWWEHLSKYNISNPTNLYKTYEEEAKAVLSMDINSIIIEHLQEYYPDVFDDINRMNKEIDNRNELIERNINEYGINLKYNFDFRMNNNNYGLYNVKSDEIKDCFKKFI
jgi:hypothetical protein